VGVDGMGHVRRPRHRGQRAAGQALQPIVVAPGGEQLRDGGHGLRDRTGYAVPAELLDGDDHIDGAGTEAAVLLVDREGVDPGLGEFGPDLAPGLGVAGVPRPDHRGQVRVAQHGVDAGGEFLVLGVEDEFHRSPLGRPRSRSAITFF